MLIEAGIGMAALSGIGWFSSRYAWWRPAINWKFPRVLMYHMVSPHRPGTRFNKLRVKPEEFEQQVKWLKNNGFTFLFASELLQRDALPERSVCLTFDDGYEDNLINADPVLERYQARATLFLVGDRSGGWSSKKKAHHADDELAREPKLSDDQVRVLLDTGRWELGGHTQTHANLNAVAEDQARDEIAAGNDTIVQSFQANPVTFAYPFGLWNDKHPELLQDLGVLGAFTTECGIAPTPYVSPMTIPRVKVSGDDGIWAFQLRMNAAKRGLFK
ncbi:polysaccharide deacetylase family protein [Planctomicrobium sp. SH668]|uniref:polysaccharide deacetylase family protein n=1 Tax=Planctomicrobium sp. SH668 TaxID=3448126 RepID=UPI003F5B2D9E